MKFITAVAALFVVTVANAQVSFTNCASGPTDFAIGTFSMTPNYMCNNILQEVCFTATGTLNNPIVEGATFDMTARYLERDLPYDRQDLCDQMATQGYPCPVPTNVTSITVCMPMRIPVWSMGFTFHAKNGDGNTLFCQFADLSGITCP